MSADRGRWGPPLALLFVTLPFLGKAHHVDDPLYLRTARHVLASPLHPLSGTSFWHEAPTTLFDDLYNPPLSAYWLAPAVAVAGDAEVPVHILMVVTAALALWAAASTGERLGVDSRWTWALFASPAVVTASVGAMADVPFLLLTLLAWRTALAGRPSASGALAALSALAKYAGLLNVPLALLALRVRTRSRAASLLAAAAAVFGGWCAWNLAVHGGLHLTAASRFQSFGLARQGLFAVHFLAGLGLAGLPAAVGLLRWTRPMAALAVGGGATVALLAPTGLPAGSGWALGFLAGASGAALLWSAGAAAARVREPFLPAAVALLAIHSFGPVYFGAVRYALPLLPPLLWLLVRGGRLPREPSGLRWSAAIGSGAALSLAFLAADTGYAGAWRRAARGLAAEGRGFHTGRWGFDAYAAEQGYRPLPPREVLRPGDVVAVPHGIHTAGPTPAQSALLARTGRIAVPSPWLRLMDREAGAGFYSSAWGVLPAAVRTGALETVTLLEPAAWLHGMAPAARFDHVVVDLGSPEARDLQLDGWSGDEAFAEAGRRRTFTWAVGRESALRLPVPEGARWIRVRAFPADAAVGRLEVAIGTAAAATLDVQPGWRVYAGPLAGTVEEGPATIVLRPRGHRRPGAFAADRRPLSIAIDVLELAARVPAEGWGDADANRGFWPVQAGEGSPALFVAGAAVVLATGSGAPVRASFGCVADEPEVRWEGAATRTLWSARACGAPEGCAVDVVSPPEPGRLVFSARNALLRGLHTRSAADPLTSGSP